MQRQRAICGHDLRPAGGQQAADELECMWNAQPRRGIEGARPVEFRMEPGRKPMAYHIRMQTRLSIATHVQERRSLRGAQPLMGVAGVIRRTQIGQADRHHAGSVRAVHQRIDAARA